MVGSEILTCRLGERLQMDALPPTCQGVYYIYYMYYIFFLCKALKCLRLILSSSLVQCPAHDVRYDSSGVILSPGWPESYPNLQMCSWSVNVEKGYNVTITFESFHTEREFDMLEIFDGKKKKRTLTVFNIYSSPQSWGSIQTNTVLYRHLLIFPMFHCLFLPLFSPSGPSANSPTLATLSGDLPTPFNVTTSGHQFLIRWSSDHGTNKKGFKIRYVGEYQSMYPNFILLLLLINVTMHEDSSRQTEGQRTWSECTRAS